MRLLRCCGARRRHVLRYAPSLRSSRLVATIFQQDLTPTLPSSVSLPPRRILLARLSAHGDVLQTLPLLTALKTAWPDCAIDWLTEPGAVPLLQNHPMIDRLLIAPRKQWLRDIPQPRHWPRIIREIAMLRRDLQSADYALSIDAQGLLKSAVWPWLAGIPVRLGFQRSREGASSFYTHTIPPMNLRDAHTSAIHRYLDFARALGIAVSKPHFVLPPLPTPIQQAMQQTMQERDRTTNSLPRIALAPFTRWSSKHWPPEHWRTLIAALLQRPCQVFCWVDPKTSSPARPFCMHFPSKRKRTRKPASFPWLAKPIGWRCERFWRPVIS